MRKFRIDIKSGPLLCPSLCLRSSNGVYFTASGYRQVIIAYYCEPNSNSKEKFFSEFQAELVQKIAFV